MQKNNFENKINFRLNNLDNINTYDESIYDLFLKFDV